MAQLMRIVLMLVVSLSLIGCYTQLTLPDDSSESRSDQITTIQQVQPPAEQIVVIAPIYVPPPPIFILPPPSPPSGQIGGVKESPAPHRTETGSRRTDENSGGSTTGTQHRTSGGGRGGR